jgi:translocation protein SEC63
MADMDCTSVVGEKTVTPGSFVQLNLKVRITPPSYSPPPALQINGKADDLAMEEADEKDIDELIGRKKAGTMGETPDIPVHAPRFPTTRMPTWSVFVGDHKLGRVFVPPTRFNQFGYNKIRTMQLTFQAPPQAGLYTFQTYVKNSSYVGADAQKDMMMEVKAPQEEENGDDDDDISEPDEDTIAGQMAAMRGQPFKKIEDGDEEEEYTSSESEEEEESSSSDSDSD